MELPEYQAIVSTRHEPGCGIDHDPEESECYTREDFLADRADEEYDRMKDGYE